MKILVTGASGFLGGNLVRHLIDHQHEVSIIIRKSADVSAIITSRSRVIYGDIDRYPDIETAVAGMDAVIHCAGMTGQFGVKPEDYERINVTATRHIINACLHHNIQKLVYVSTANTIAPGSRQQPGTELNGFSLFKANSGYINTKYVAQQLVLEHVVSHQLPAVVVNPTFMIGPNDAKPGSGQMLLYGLNKRVLFYPGGGKNFVHVDDVCIGIINALEKGKTGSCYLLAGENLSYAEFFKKVSKVANQKPLMIRIPNTILRIAGRMGTLTERITRKPQKLTRPAAFMLCLDNYYSNTKAEQELGLKFRPAQHAIEEAYLWFSENNFVAGPARA